MNKDFLEILNGCLGADLDLNNLKEELGIHGEERVEELFATAAMVADYDVTLAREFVRHASFFMRSPTQDVTVKLAALACAILQRQPAIALHVVREGARLLARVDFDTLRVVEGLSEAISLYSINYAHRVWEEAERIVEDLVEHGATGRTPERIYRLALSIVQDDWGEAFALPGKMTKSVINLLGTLGEEQVETLLSLGEAFSSAGAEVLDALASSGVSLITHPNVTPEDREKVWQTISEIVRRSPKSASEVLRSLPHCLSLLEEKNCLGLLGVIFEQALRLSAKSGRLGEGFIRAMVEGGGELTEEDMVYLATLTESIAPSGYLPAIAFVDVSVSLWQSLGREGLAQAAFALAGISGISPEVGVHFMKVSPGICEKGGSRSWSLISRFISEVTALDRAAAMRFLEKSLVLAEELAREENIAWQETAFDLGRELAIINARVAVAFLEHSPSFLKVGGVSVLSEIAAIARHLGKENWSAAVAMLSSASDLVEQMGIKGLSLLAEMAHRLQTNYSYGSISLWAKVVELLEHRDGIERAELMDLLTQVGKLAETNGRLVLSLIELLPKLIGMLSREELTEVMEVISGAAITGNAGKRLIDLCPVILESMGLEGFKLLGGLVKSIYPSLPDETLSLIENTPHTLGRYEAIDEGSAALLVYRRGVEVCGKAPRFAVALIEKGPDLISSLGVVGFEIVSSHLIRIACLDEKEAISVISRDIKAMGLFAQGVPEGITIKEVKPVLGVYLKALLGKRVEILEGRKTFTDGERIYLPGRIRDYVDEQSNFRLYKVMATLEEAKIEYGGIGFSVGKLRELLDYVLKKHGKSLSMEKGRDVLSNFCALFPEPALIRDLVEIMERFRIERVLLREYPGLRRDIGFYNQHQAKKKVPPNRILNMKHRLVELIAHGLMEGVAVGEELSGPLRGICERSWAKARFLEAKGTDIHDAVRVAVSVYEDITAEIKDPYRSRHFRSTAPTDRRPSLDMDSLARASQALERHLKGMPGGTPSGMRVEREGGERESSARYDRSPSGLSRIGQKEGRSDTGKTMRGDGPGRRGPVGKDSLAFNAPPPLRDVYPPEKIERILKSVYRDHGLTPEEVERRVTMMMPYEAFLFLRSLEYSLEKDTELMAEPGTFLYPEWDADMHEYRANWVRVREQTLQGGSINCYRDVMEKYRGLVKKIRREFQLLRPDSLKKRKHEREGTEIDLDRMVEYLIDCRLKITPPEGNYIMPHRLRRDIAVSFLLDMSRSTKGSVIEREKEACFIISEALHEVGDSFGIFGFSGDRRDNVEFYIIKSFDEPYGEQIKERISAITDHYENRDGAAIRHAVHMLKKRRERTKILILISDGKPVDKEYNGSYAVEDTRMALKEAFRDGIKSFCITVDKKGAEYLPRMYSSSRWVVMDDISQLPERITGIYRMLTT